MVGVVGFCLAVLFGWGVVGALLSEPYGVFTKEPLEQFPDAPPYAGILAHATWFLWVVGATTATFAAWLVSLVDREAREIRFLIGAAALTAFLFVDDFAMLHERAFPRLGLPEEAVYVGYAVGFSFLLARFRPQLERGGALIALAAGAAWATSLGADFLQEHFDVFAHAVEDGAKLIGTALWTWYVTKSSLWSVSSRIGSS